ncbi:MAG TPA: ABC transporter substrate-binding protein [Bacteroidales bacterium]|nr:ABC transporter substrate-binding protein [Bacteroidales bacterium]
MRVLTCFFVFFILIINYGCTHRNQGQKDSVRSNAFKELPIKYAKGFTIRKVNNSFLLSVQNPWQGARNIVYRYLLVPRGEKVPEGIDDVQIIRTPVKKIICMSTTYIAMIDLLGETETIKGISGSSLVNNKQVRKMLKNGAIRDVGYDQGLNFEEIIGLNPDLLMTYGVSGNHISSVHKLENSGVKVVYNAEYLENTPLGKAEWIKFIGAFYGKEEIAASYFDSIADLYNNLKELTSSVKEKPVVLTGLPWKESWYVPGGKSFMANFIKDAGGNYLWRDDDSRESFPLDLEAVFNKGMQTDVWINTGSAGSLKEIADVDDRLTNLGPFRKMEIYNNNARLNQFGGNDYWESGVIKPHIILKDLIKIFHPELLSDHQFYFYKKLN